MSVTERKAREKAALRQEILAAARDLFAKHGYESVSMRKIAERIEYSPTTIYLHFRDKGELLNEICAETFQLLSKKLAKVVASEGDPVDLLRRGLRVYVDFGLSHPNHYRTTFMTPHQHPPQPETGEQKINFGTGGQAFQYLMDAVGRVMATGPTRQTDVMAASQALWMTVHGVTSLLITKEHEFPWSDKNRLIDIAIEGAAKGLLR
ncbi:MAG: TetR/AcrR family transcriptional regulator [Bryobacteraceae bacterium]|jgi:AcrR family transcriptional regulator